MSLFVYGTLMSDKLFNQVVSLDSNQSLIKNKAKLHNYVRRKVKNRSYPAIFKVATDDDEEFVEGILISGLTEYELTKVHLYEGDEYKLTVVNVFDIENNRFVEASS